MALLRRLDELLEEATRLRGEVENAMKVKKPFWPERRQQRKPVAKDRRG